MDKVFRFLAPIERFAENLGRAFVFVFARLFAFGVGMMFLAVGVIAFIHWIPLQWRSEVFVWSKDYPIGIFFFLEGLALVMWGMVQLLSLSLQPTEELLE